jgi:small redox-active disulfide protein 2
VLGTGCASCRKLYHAVEVAIRDTGVPATLVKVEDYGEIMRYGVMSTPALVIDRTVVCAGKVPDGAQISQWLAEAAQSR